MNMAGNSEMILQTNSVNWFDGFEHPKYHICTSNTFNLTILSGNSNDIDKSSIKNKSTLFSLNPNLIEWTEMGFVDTEMISYLILSTSLFVASPAFLQDEQRQRQMEIRFNEILTGKGVKDINEIFQRALLKYYL